MSQLITEGNNNYIKLVRDWDKTAASEIVSLLKPIIGEEITTVGDRVGPFRDPRVARAVNQLINDRGNQLRSGVVAKLTRAGINKRYQNYLNSRDMQPNTPMPVGFP